MEKVTKQALKERLSKEKVEAIAIFGPTASGKTALALELAEDLNFDIISVDSRQVYRFADVVTGKDIPTSFKFVDRGYFSYYSSPKGFRVYGLSLVLPSGSFSLGLFLKQLPLWVKEIKDHHRRPLLVGGTIHWFYRLLTGEYGDVFVPEDKKWRRIAADLAVEELQRKLLQLDPTLPSRISNSDWFNKRRLIRWYERLESKKVGLSKVEELEKIRSLKLVNLLLDIPDTLLVEKIKKRIEERLRKGAIEETKSLIKIYGTEINLLSAPGYEQIKEFLDQQVDERQLKEKWLRAELSLVKKQRQWIKKLIPLVTFKVEVPLHGGKKGGSTCS